MSALIKVTVFSAILIILCGVLGLLFPETILHAKIYVIISFLWFIYASIHMTYFVMQNKLKLEEPMMPMIGLVIRFLVSLFALMGVLLRGVENEQLFVLNFIAFYLFYVVFEIISLFRNLRQNSTQENKK